MTACADKAKAELTLHVGDELTATAGWALATSGRRQAGDGGGRQAGAQAEGGEDGADGRYYRQRKEESEQAETELEKVAEKAELYFVTGRTVGC